MGSPSGIPSFPEEEAPQVPQKRQLLCLSVLAPWEGSCVPVAVLAVLLAPQSSRSPLCAAWDSSSLSLLQVAQSCSTGKRNSHPGHEGAPVPSTQSVTSPCPCHSSPLCTGWVHVLIGCASDFTQPCTGKSLARQRQGGLSLTNPSGFSPGVELP